MEEIVKQMMIYRRLGIGCLVGMILAFMVTVYCYKKMNMKDVLDYFKRKRKLLKKLFLLWIVLVFGMSMPVMATQMEGVTEEDMEPKDDEPPMMEISYHDVEGRELVLNEDGSKLLPYYNPAKEILAEFHVTEQFLDEERSSIKIISRDRKGNLLKEELVLLEEGMGSAAIKEDGHYQVSAYLVDMTGNETTYEITFALDYTPPKEPVIHYQTENQGRLARLWNQLTFGYFAKEKITAHILTEDTVSGVKQVTYSYQDVDTEEIFTETVETAQEEIVAELPFSFRGKLQVTSEDYLGNVSEVFTDIGVIAESETTHKENVIAQVQVLTDYSKTPDYYAGDVEVQFTVKDSYSGIQKVIYTAGNEIHENVSYEEETEIITEEIVKQYKILATENQANEVPVALEFTDNTGHLIVVEEENLPKIHIDTAAPKIQVEYDNQDAVNEKYYRESRTATIYVEERNFDPEDVDFDITGPAPEIHGWSHQAGVGCQGSGDPYDTGHSDSCVWKCEVDFKEDGEYSFCISCTDLAGNHGSYDRTDEFVIDQTSPVMQVNYDNHDVRNEVYYNAPRRARIVITEKNFDPKDAEIYMTAENKEQPIEVPNISSWASNGEQHQAVITYDYDGIFTFDISYTDLAGNEAADYSEDYFVVDLTKPQILIGRIADKSANKGEVSPVIMVTDTNYMSGTTWTELIGWQNGIMDVPKEITDLADGISIKIADFEHTKEMDDLYRLTVGTEDLAGNTVKTQLRFSVNRFGSVYTLDERTEQLAGTEGSYYTDKERRMIVTETNVDTLTFREIVCSLNGKLKTLKKGADYEVMESGDDTSWKQYRYLIYADNFAEEGYYTLTIYSEDRAGNASDNQSKGKSISFAVDKSAPDIGIFGIEPEGKYRESSREIIIDTQDNLGVEKLMIFLNGDSQIYDMKTLHESDGRIKINVKSSNQWQTLKAAARDCTGNEVLTEEIAFLVTPNVLVQFYNHKPLFYGSLVGVGICLVIVLHKILRFSLFNSSNS